MLSFESIYEVIRCTDNVGSWHDYIRSIRWLGWIISRMKRLVLKPSKNCPTGFSSRVSWANTITIHKSMLDNFVECDFVTFHDIYVALIEVPTFITLNVDSLCHQQKHWTTTTHHHLYIVIVLNYLKMSFHIFSSTCFPKFLLVFFI